jgi:xanthine dehydrogenase small subunit
LKDIRVTGGVLSIGAGVTYSEAEGPLIAEFGHLAEVWDRIAGWQVRNMGTIGGNIANGSPIGDTPPVLIALGARVHLRRGKVARDMALEDYFIAYGKQDRAKGEFVEKITVPIGAGGLHAAYKISKRRDEDISSLCVAFNVVVEDGVIRAARIAFGGMAATPKRAVGAEAALLGQPMTEGSFVNAAKALQGDFKPLTDMRASAEYRMLAAQNLFRRFYLEQAGDGAEVRLVRGRA